MPVQTRAQKWGGSVTAPIPAAIAKRLHIAPGSAIEVAERNGSVVVTPIRRQRRSLDNDSSFVQKKFPKGNPHGEFDYGPPVGKEVW